MNLSYTKCLFVLGALLLSVGCGKSSAPSKSANQPGIDASASLSPHEIVQAIADAYDSLPPFSMRIDIENRYRQKQVDGEIVSSWPISPTYYELRVDGERVHVLHPGNSRRHEPPAWRAMWTGNQYLERSWPNRPQSIYAGSVSNNEIRRSRIRIANWHLWFLMGISEVQAHHIAMILKQADDLTLGSSMEDVDGHACYVVEASSEDGRFTVYVDPDYGFNIRRMLIEMSLDEIQYVYPLRWGRFEFHHSEEGAGEIVKIRAEMSDVVLKKQGEFFVPVEGQMTIERTRYDGSVTRYGYTARRSEIVWNPDFKKLKAFIMDGIPEGASIQVIDLFPDMPDGHYIWKKGKAVPTRTPTPTPQRRPIS